MDKIRNIQLGDGNRRPTQEIRLVGNSGSGTTAGAVHFAMISKRQVE